MINLDDLIAPQPKKQAWSSLQEDIFAALYSPNNLIIEAVAGSGKTTTILECMNRAGGKALFLAFNKAIADDLRSRVRGAEVRTLNALGHSIVTKRLPGAKLESYKVSNLVRSKLSTEDYPQIGQHICRLVSLAKGAGFGILRPGDRGDFLALADTAELDIPADLLSTATVVARTCFFESAADTTSFDFDDQLFLPVYKNWDFPSFEQVYIDEAQDLNTIQHLMLERLRNNGARIIAVGDTCQAIYGFRGALHGSMFMLKHAFEMDEYPLSITYRCDREIVSLAQTLVPHIRSRDGADLGLVEYIDAIDIASLTPNEMVVCRNNAPIFALGVQALLTRTPVRILSNFTEQLKAFIKSFKTQDLSILASRLDKWLEHELSKAEENEQFGRAHYLEDKAECVRSLMQGASSINDMLNALEKFSNSTSGPILSTIHKAKGLEAETVTILHREKLPSRYALTPSALQQENNLLYVAITRAKHNLRIHIGE